MHEIDVPTRRKRSGRQALPGIEDEVPDIESSRRHPQALDSGRKSAMATRQRPSYNGFALLRKSWVMQIQETRKDGYLIVGPVGRLDSSTSRLLDRSLTSAIQRGDTRISLDMSRLDYIGSMGLSVLLAAAKRIKAARGELSLYGLNERVKLVFEMSGFLRLFNIRDGL